MGAYRKTHHHILMLLHHHYGPNGGTCLFRDKTEVILRRYGIELWQYWGMFLIQRGACNFCGEELNGRTCVDHNHETGNVRGILHQRCNVAIGTTQKIFKLGLLSKALKWN